MTEQTKQGIIYHGTTLANFMSILKTGYITDIRYNSHVQSVWTTKDYNIAKNIAMLRRMGNDSIPCILVINSVKLQRDGYILQKVRDMNYLSDDIPKAYILGATCV